MSQALAASPGFSLGGINFKELQHRAEEWIKAQPPAVEVAITTFGAAAQGGFIGYLLGSVSGMDPGALANPNDVSPMANSMKAFTGGPWAQAKSLAVLMGVNAGAQLAIKKARKGKEDVYGRCALTCQAPTHHAHASAHHDAGCALCCHACTHQAHGLSSSHTNIVLAHRCRSMAASFCSGACYTLVSGGPNLFQTAFTTGVAFALFNGLFYQVGASSVLHACCSAP